MKHTPKAVKWYKLYAGFLGLLNLLVLGIGIAFLIFHEELGEAGDGPVVTIIYGVFFCGLGLVASGAGFAGAFLPAKPWAWTYGMVLICLGMSSCTMVFSIPLLIYWLKPEIQEYFGKVTHKKHAVTAEPLPGDSPGGTDESRTRDYSNPYNSD